MFGKGNDSLSSLAARKRLLVAESELNRTQLRREWQEFVLDADHFVRRVKSLSTVTAVLVSLAVGLAGRPKSKAAPANAPSSWLRRLARGARLASNVWMLIRALGKLPEER